MKFILGWKGRGLRAAGAGEEAESEGEQARGEGPKDGDAHGEGIGEAAWFEVARPPASGK